jgi:hypothetical protein
LPFRGFEYDIIAATPAAEGNQPANPMSTPMETNRRHWDHMTDLHARENVYGIDDFKKGPSSSTGSKSRSWATSQKRHF